MTERTFKIFAPLQFFEKAGEPPERQRRIAGVITTERKDREGETILQRGLDFSEFMDAGYFNDNHAKDSDGVVGEPDAVKFFRKGDKLPNGDLAVSNCHWSEGFLYSGDARADKVWAKGLTLQKSGGRRRLGFSIEGVIERRTGPDNKVIAKAKVRNVAVTHCPVNTDTALIALEKSLMEADEDEAEKALTATGGVTPGIKPTGPMTGAGAGAILTVQSLDCDAKDPKKKQLSKADATAWLQRKYPNITKGTAERAVEVIFASRGLL